MCPFSRECQTNTLKLLKYDSGSDVVFQGREEGVMSLLYGGQ